MKRTIKQSLGEKKLLAVLCAALLSCALLFGCTAQSTSNASSGNEASSSAAVSNDAPEAPEEEVTISVTVTGEKDGISINDATDMSVAAGVTALDALQLVSSDVIVEESSYGPFVSSIGGLANEGSSGWTYTVNGEYVAESAGTYILADGDVLAWTYYVG